MSASLATLVGIPNAPVRTDARSNLDHSLTRPASGGLPGPRSVARCEADSTMPPRTMPGKPTEARWALGSGPTNLASTATRRSGGIG